MLEILGSIAGNFLSLPGVLGLTLGLLTRRLVLAALVGGLVGVSEAMIFVQFDFANITGLEMSIGVLVGIFAGTVGSLIRRKGTKVRA